MPRRLDFDGGMVTNWSPPTQFAVITPSDATDLTSAKIRALWVGTAGNVAILGLNDSVPVTLANVPAGTLLLGMVKKVMATGTTASNIVGES